GELVQLDGSFHEWLQEERGRRGVDDATSTVSCQFSLGHDDPNFFFAMVKPQPGDTSKWYDMEETGLCLLPRNGLCYLLPVQHTGPEVLPRSALCRPRRPNPF